MGKGLPRAVQALTRGRLNGIVTILGVLDHVLLLLVDITGALEKNGDVAMMSLGRVEALLGDRSRWPC